jgi:hypothetical protein
MNRDWFAQFDESSSQTWHEGLHIVAGAMQSAALIATLSTQEAAWDTVSVVDQSELSRGAEP